MNPLQQFAMNLIQQKMGGDLSKLSPQQQTMIQAIQTNDANLGIELATNLCQTYGRSKDQAIEDARKFFRI